MTEQKEKHLRKNVGPVQNPEMINQCKLILKLTFI